MIENAHFIVIDENSNFDGGGTYYIYNEVGNKPGAILATDTPNVDTLVLGPSTFGGNGRILVSFDITEGFLAKAGETYFIGFDPSATNNLRVLLALTQQTGEEGIRAFNSDSDINNR